MLTLVFTDMEDSSVWWRTLDSDFLPVLKRHDALIESLVSECNGTPLEKTGDGFFLIFDRPDNAIRFSEKTLRALQNEPWTSIHPQVEKLRVRIGIHCGSPSVYPSEERARQYRGHDVNKAARVMDTAHGGTAVLSGVVNEVHEDRTSRQEEGRHICAKYSAVRSSNPLGSPCRRVERRS